MNRLLIAISVFVGAAIPALEVWVAVPAGIVLGLNPALAATVGFVGNAATLVPIILAGDRLRAWWRTKRRTGAAEDDGAAHPSSARSGRAQRLVERFGVPGLAFLGPFVIGIHVAALAAVSIGAERRRILVWFLLALAATAALFAAITALGVTAFVEPERLPGL